jgi:ribosomal protein S18 acetylase RimI-like enzyme
VIEDRAGGARPPPGDGLTIPAVKEAITLRLAEPRDAAAIAVMTRDLIEAGLGWKYDAARIGRAIRHRDTVVLAACERGALRGFAVMEFGDERAHLVLLAVSPAHRRRGIGRGLLEWLLKSARTAGIASVHLELRAGNEAARRFYRAMDFSETVLVPGYYGGREPALRMIRVLRLPGTVPLAWQPPWLPQK